MKNDLRKLVITVFALCIAVVVNITVMIRGWGLEPKSWGWIIGAYLAGHTLAAVLMILGKDKP